MAEIKKQSIEESTIKEMRDDQKKQIFDNSSQEDASSKVSATKSANCKIQEDSTYRSKKSVNSNIKSQKNNKTTDTPTSSEIRELLVKNLPELQAEIRTFDQEDLYGLYNQFRQASQPQPKSTNAQKIQMMTAILKQLPSMKDKLCNCTEAQIKKFYHSLKSVRTHPSCVLPKKKGKRPQLNKTFPPPKQNLRQMEKFKQILNSTQQKSIKFNQFNDPQYQNGSLRQQHQFTDKNSSKTHERSKKRNFQTAFANNKYLGGAQLQIPLLRKEKDKDNFWEMEHGEGDKVTGKTYVLVHTQYEDQPRKRLKGQSNIGKCICSCCKNNTFANIFKQIIQQIESRKK